MIYLKQDKNNLEALIPKPLEFPSYDQFINTLDKFKVQEGWELTVTEDLNSLSREDIKWDKENSKIIHIGFYYPLFNLNSRKRLGITSLNKLIGFLLIIINPEFKEYIEIKGNLGRSFRNNISVLQNQLDVSTFESVSIYTSIHLDYLYTQFLLHYIVNHVKIYESLINV